MRRWQLCLGGSLHSFDLYTSCPAYNHPCLSHLQIGLLNCTLYWGCPQRISRSFNWYRMHQLCTPREARTTHLPCVASLLLDPIYGAGFNPSWPGTGLSKELSFPTYCIRSCKEGMLQIPLAKDLHLWIPRYMTSVLWHLPYGTSFPPD